MKRKFTFIFSMLLGATLVMAQESNGIDIDRANWTITTQTGTGYSHVPDGWMASESKFTTGFANDLLDGNAGTYLSLIKPGKTYSPGNGAEVIPVQPAGIMPSFTVDMKSAKTFDYIKWRHRDGKNPAGGSNTYNYLRVFGVDIEGSNTGNEDDFTKINTDGIVWIPNSGGYSGSKTVADPEEYMLMVPKSTYQYVRVKYVKWSDNYVGGDYAVDDPKYTTNGAASGSSMQVGEFGLGLSTSSGVKNNAIIPAKLYPSVVDPGQMFTIHSELELEKAYLTIYTLAGSKVSESVVRGKRLEQKINQSGMYIIELKSSQGSFITKLVVK